MTHIDKKTENSEILLAGSLTCEKDWFPPLGRYLKKIHPKSKFFLAKQRRPLMLICETVNICNNDCIICAHSIMKRAKKTMSLESFKKVLHDYSEIGGGKLSLTPMIGDIFLDKFLLERLKMVQQYSKVTGLSVTTNAILSDKFSDDELRFILENFERVHISIYGLDDEEYLTMTRKSHYFRMLRNVKRIIEISPKKKSIVFGFRLLKNHTELDIRSWIIKNFDCEIPFSSTRVFSNWGGAIDTSVKLPFKGEWLQPRENIEPCIIPLIVCQIFSNGDVSFCACTDFDIDEELRLGNIMNNHLIDILNSEKAKKLMNSSEKMPDYCRYCSFHKSLTESAQNNNAIQNPIDFIGG